MTGWVRAHEWAAITACLIVPAAGAILGVTLIIIGCSRDVARQISTRFAAWNTADLDKHAGQAIAVTRPPGRTRVVWHMHPCGCWCASTGRGMVCPAHAAGLQEIRDLFDWDQEMHQ